MHMKRRPPLHVAFVPWMVAGVRSQWENMRPYVTNRPDIQPRVVEVHPYKAGGLVERLPVVPSNVKGTLREMMSATPLFRAPRVDAIWTSDIRALLPFSLTKGLLQRPVIVTSTDATIVQQANFGDFYGARANRSVAGRLRNAMSTLYQEGVTVVGPWSEWAAISLIDDLHVPSSKVRVLSPGIDLRRWTFVERRRLPGDAVRLLFVGGDFVRKGGDLLLDVFTERLRNHCELHLVTRDPVQERPGVYVYRNFGPNDPGLRDLYARCDVFVLPTRADCFSLASIEAMAMGLPVVTTAIGGIPEIVADGRSGFLIGPDDGQALAERIEKLVESPRLRLKMGTEGRRIAEARFDAAKNTDHLLDTILDLCAARATARNRTIVARRRS